jgi:fructosamine-3-kinase
VTNLDLLLDRLRTAGLPAASAEPATGGVVALAGIATLEDGRVVFAKTLSEPRPDLFTVEAEGLRALAGHGVRVPGIVAVTADLLVLEPLPPHGDDEAFWTHAGRMFAALHATTRGDRFGWHRDGWLGRLRQDNTWTDDGPTFFAERRILRWLGEPAAEAALDRADREALERLCAALPSIMPDRPPVLTHGDLWGGNIIGDGNGGAVFIDPAVAYGWAEADLSMLWCTSRPPVADWFDPASARAAQRRRARS